MTGRLFHSYRMQLCFSENRKYHRSHGFPQFFSAVAVIFFALLFTGCGAREKEITPSAAAMESSSAASSREEFIIIELSETEQETEPETIPEPETEEPLPIDDETPPGEGMVRSPITNEWTTEELAGTRPVAVMYPMDKKAQPQYGLDRIQVLYEIMEEGSMSRQMAIMTDRDGLERIGNIRSTRLYYIQDSMEWDSILVHFGGPEVFVKDLLNRSDVDNINGVGGVMGSDYGAYFRVPAGSKSEHTAYTDSSHLEAAIKKAGFETKFRDGYWQPKRWRFSPASKQIDLSGLPECADALEIDMTGCFPITKSSFRYDPEDGLYYRSIYGSPQKDAITGTQLAFKNILIESCTWKDLGLGYLSIDVVAENRSGYYITNGKIIPCTWTKSGEYEVTRFYDRNGKEITLNTGKTMICIGRDCDSFTVDEVKYEL